MADGTKKSIDKVKVGDKVLATDPKTGKSRTETVTATIIGKGKKRLVKVTVFGGAKDGASSAVVATEGHPFWVPAVGEWVDAGDLEPGDSVWPNSGTELRISEVQEWTERATVYNLTVADLHTYYVLAGVIPVLVHNCGDGAESVSPAFEDDPYHPDKVQKRIDAGRAAWAEIPREVHNTVNGIESGRVTQRVNSNGRDWFNANGNTSSPWHNATIFTGVASPTTLTRVLLRRDGGIGYVLGHNYNKVIEYGYARLPGRYVPRP